MEDKRKQVADDIRSAAAHLSGLIERACTVHQPEVLEAVNAPTVEIHIEKLIDRVEVTTAPDSSCNQQQQPHGSVTPSPEMRIVEKLLLLLQNLGKELKLELKEAPDDSGASMSHKEVVKSQ